MPIERSKRIMMRIRQEIIRGKKHYIKLYDMERIVMYEAGVSPQTIRNYRVALQKLGWIKIKRSRVYLTDADLTEDIDARNV